MGFVEGRGQERGCGIPNANNVGPRADLSSREGDLQIRDPVHQVIDEAGVILGVEHEVGETPQVGGLGDGTLDPAVHLDLAPQGVGQVAHGENPIDHPWSGLRLHRLKLDEVSPFGQERPCAAGGFVVVVGELGP